jgi:nucleoside-diphosphate-sugar epimerase
MRVAILGASSQVGRGFIKECLQRSHDVQLMLFARSHEKLNTWLSTSEKPMLWRALSMDAFGQHSYDAIINLIGSGDPGQTQVMGRSIVDISDQYDMRVLTYLQKNPSCKYLFFSSGAVYQGNFDCAISAESVQKKQIDAQKDQDWYALSKLRAEARHRDLAQMDIIDIRLFSYFCADQNPQARFLLSDIMRALYTGDPIITTEMDIHRDYLGPEDMYALIWSALRAGRSNTAIDTYSLSPVSKLQILNRFAQVFDLTVVWQAAGVRPMMQATKTNYYSKNHTASRIGFYPAHHSLDILEKEMKLFVRHIEFFRQAKTKVEDLVGWIPLSWDMHL